MTRAIALTVTAAVLVWAATEAAPVPPALYPDREIDSDVGRPADVAYSSDGRFLAVAGSTGLSVWDAAVGKLIKREAATGLVRVAFNPAGNAVAAGGADGRVVIADLVAGGLKEVARHPKTVRAIAFQPGGRLGASSDVEGTILLWDPNGGTIGTLKDGSSKADVLFLAFSAPNALLSLTGEMTVITWDVAGKRPLRRGGLQASVSGRRIFPAAASLDVSGGKLVVAAQLVASQRSGVLSGGSNLANPADLRRENVLIPYDVTSGISGDAIVSGDFKSDAVALSPAGCYAFFTSYYRDQARLHVWGLIEKGDDLVRQDLPKRAVAVALDREGRAVAAATDTGRVHTFKVSGTGESDCVVYARRPNQTAAAEPKITVDSETTPLIQTRPGLSVAVLRFETNNAAAELGDFLAENVSGELTSAPGLVVVERTAIEKVAGELALQRSGLTSSADAVRLGKGVNANKVVLGSVRKIGDDTFYLTVRVVDVETQRNEGQRAVTCERCKEQHLLQAAKELRRLLVR